MKQITFNFDAYKRAEQKFKAICEPLFKSTPITDVYYGRLYPNGRYVGVNTHADWFKTYLERFPDFLIPSNLVGEHEGFFLSTTVNPTELLELSKSFDITDAINLVVQKTDYIEEFGFSTNVSQKGMVEFYFNNLPILKKFVDELPQKIEPILEDKALEIKMPKALFNTPSEPLVPMLLEKKKLEMHSEEIVKSGIKLSDRELETFKHLLKGKTRKQMAEVMNVAVPTVGTYVTRVMNKVGCRTRSDLLLYAWDKGILTMKDFSNKL